MRLDPIARRVRALLGGALLAAGTAVAQPGYHCPPPPMAYPPPGYGHRDLRSCGFHARDQAYRYASPGARRRWRRFARRGAALQRAQHSVPSLKARAQRERDYAYSDAFDDCMRGFRR